MRVLYLTQALSSHDRRFIAALADAGHHIALASMSAADEGGSVQVTRVAADNPTAIREAAAASDIVHAGPLDTAGYRAARLGLRPLVAVSWAYDVLLQRSRSVTSRVQQALSTSSLLIADCEAVVDASRDLGYAGPSVVFPWGVDLELFQPSPRREAPVPTVICTRAWEPIYQVPTVVRAFARQSAPARLVLLNRGSQRREIVALIRELGLSNRVAAPGHLPEPGVADELRAATLYVSASLVDGASVSMLQALATGLPIVATDIACNRLWLGGLRGARLVEAGDARGWADAMSWGLGLASTEREEIGREHRELAERRADWRHHAKTLVAAYEWAWREGPKQNRSPRG